MLKQICRDLGVLEKSPCQCCLQFAGFLNIEIELVDEVKDISASKIPSIMELQKLKD